MTDADLLLSKGYDFVSLPGKRPFWVKTYDRLSENEQQQPQQRRKPRSAPRPMKHERSRRSK